MFLFCFSAQVSGQEDGTALMLEMTPPQGGNLNIVPGVHSFDRFAAVTLIATPKPGYQFVYWLGNVSDATAGTTTVYLDSPKMVIAVFTQNKFETIGMDGDAVGGEGSGGLLRSSSSYSSNGGGGGGGNHERDPHEPDVPDSFGENEHDPHSPDVPAPVPEPATAVLFFAGFLALAKRRRNGANTIEKM